MLTYAEIMTTDFAALTTAAEKWESMAGEIKKVEDRYKDTVQKVTMGPNWLGLTAGVAHTNFAGTRYEYAAAQTQAKAVGSLLRDAHTQFVDLKKKLDSARTDAIDAGMTISEEGRVSFDYAKLTDSERRAYRNDPDGQRAISEAVATWQKHIDDRVKAVSDADEGVKIALEAVVIDSNKDIGGKGDDQLNGFNAGAKGDIELYEAENAKDIATRINNGEKVSAADYAELNRSFRDNADDKKFSQTFIGGMGADGTIKLANALNDRAHSGDQSQRGLYRDVNKGLADTLAGATAVPEFKGSDGKKLVYGSKAYQDAFADWSKTSDAKFYHDFMGDLRKSGVEKYELDVAGDKISVGTGHGQEVRGYQALATLMQQGSGYSPQFLGDLTDDMIAAEKKDKNIWDLHGSFDDKKDGWFKNDPVDGVLNVMSRDPEAATGYLDPKSGDVNSASEYRDPKGEGNTNDRLKYLLKDRDWDFVNTTDWRGNIEITGKDTFDKDVRAGLGLALEAATTGHAAGSPGTELGRHSEAQARIMHDAINLIDYGDAEGKEGDPKRLGRADEVLAKEDYANMRDPLARAMASYTPDVVDTIAGEGPGKRVGLNEALANGDDSQIQNSRSSLLRFMRGVSEVPDGSAESKNFNLLYQSQLGYMSEQLATGDFSKPDALENRAQKIGEVYGTITAVGGDLDLDIRDQKNSEAGNQRFYGYHVMGGAITGIPVIGDMAQRTVDIVLNERLSVIQSENGLLTKETLATQNDKAHDTLDKFFAGWNAERHAVDPDTLGRTQNEARQSYNGARQITFEALRSRS
ncbi:hypothetical protein [Streptomyces sp. NPDC126499]|uniref:hypothetical protein n=1 Tax=Streptomyces sp. NPDC126499 TaxID=3155314 RepID=UPI003324F727